ncbi:MAG: hypothetical protein QG670_947 [Thermoproteota archaeon]|nr:hypothetical protein [Thermoproteota archaeon]
MKLLSFDSLASGWGKALGVDRKQFNMFFETMMEGFAYHKIIVDKMGKPVDYVVLEVNHAFEEMTRLKKEQVIGKKVTEALPGIEKDPADWIGVYGHVALTGEPAQFENYSKNLDRWFKVSSYCPEKGYFAAVFEDITERRKAEEGLRKSEERFRVITEMSPVQFSVSSISDSTILFTNPAYEQAFGFAKGEFIGKKGPDLYYDPTDRRTLIDTLKREGSVQGYEVRVKRKDGTLFWVSASVIPINFDGKKALLGASIDITERKMLEAKNEEYSKHLEALVEARTKDVITERQRLYNVLETLPVYVILLDKDYHVPFANKFFRERFGESQGRCCFKYLFNRSEACENCETYKVMKTNSPHHWEWTGPDKRNYDIYDFPFIEADGSNIILEMGIDITEWKRAQESLRSASQYVRSLIEAALDPLVTISVDGKVTDVNEATVKVTGVSREEIIGTDFSNYFTEPEKAREGYQKVFSEGSVTDYPLTMRGRDSRLVDVSYNATVYRNEAGEIQGVFAAARDITEHNALERKLKDSERLATIGATAGMVGHDLRNPLQSVSGAVYLAKEDANSLPQDTPVKQSLEENLSAIESQVEYMNKIVSDLQDFVRPINPQVEEVDNKKLFNNTLSMITIPAEIKVEAIVEEGKVNIDPALITRVLNNLIVNAIQAMPKGGNLTLKAHKEDNTVLLSVSDTGIGIPDDVKPKLFTPLFTTKSKGQGFGLAVCKRVVEAHGGKITFESEAGKGATFTIRIPSIK